MRQTADRLRRWRPGAIAVVILCAGLGFVAYEKFLARDISIYPDDEQNFKYGSIGNDGATGVPYAIWIVLPKVFPEYLPGPGGYASLGFRWEPGRTQSDAPLGFSRARVGVERMFAQPLTVAVPYKPLFLFVPGATDRGPRQRC